MPRDKNIRARRLHGLQENYDNCSYPKLVYEAAPDFSTFLKIFGNKMLRECADDHHDDCMAIPASAIYQQASSSRAPSRDITLTPEPTTRDRSPARRAASNSRAASPAKSPVKRKRNVLPSVETDDDNITVVTSAHSPKKPRSIMSRSPSKSRSMSPGKKVHWGKNQSREADVTQPSPKRRKTSPEKTAASARKTSPAKSVSPKIASPPKKAVSPKKVTSPKKAAPPPKATTSKPPQNAGRAKGKDREQSDAQLELLASAQLLAEQKDAIAASPKRPAAKRKVESELIRTDLDREIHPNLNLFGERFHFTCETVSIESNVTLDRDDEIDMQILNKLQTLRHEIKTFVESLPMEIQAAYSYWGEGDDLSKSLIKNAQPELYVYGGYIGNPCPTKGWDELLLRPDYRRAMICGIINRALKEHVFNSLLFGGTEKQLHDLKVMEENSAEKDGFLRTAQRANYINKSLPGATLPANHQTATVHLALQLNVLLGALFRSEKDIENPSHFTHLLSIVELATDLHLDMRRQPDVVYYPQPIFKDEEFDPSRMSCANLRPTQEDCPLINYDENGHEIPSGNPKGDSSDIALVRVVLFQGLVAYRKGGGALAEEMLERERWARHVVPLVKDQRWEDGRKAAAKRPVRDVGVGDGFRSKVLAKGIVALGWGKQRRLWDRRKGEVGEREDEESQEQEEGQVQKKDKGKAQDKGKGKAKSMGKAKGKEKEKAEGEAEFVELMDIWRGYWDPILNPSKKD